MEEKLLSYIKENWNPASVILHGSRAYVREREHSDWDFICLFPDDAQNPGNFRALVEGQNIEIFSVTLPVRDVLNTFGTKLRNARVLFDTNATGEKIFEDAQALYQKPYPWPSTWPEGPKLWMLGRLDGMRDAQNEPQQFLRYLGQFHQRALNYWYQIKQKEHSKPIYQALDEIREKDAEYFTYLEILGSMSNSPKEKLDAGEKNNYSTV